MRVVCTWIPSLLIASEGKLRFPNGTQNGIVANGIGSCRVYDTIRPCLFPLRTDTNVSHSSIWICGHKNKREKPANRFSTRKRIGRYVAWYRVQAPRKLERFTEKRSWRDIQRYTKRPVTASVARKESDKKGFGRVTCARALFIRARDSLRRLHRRPISRFNS